MNVVSWSGGKDSTATIILAHEHGIPIDAIVMSVVWFDKENGISGEYPEHLEWSENVAKPVFESWGYPTYIVSCDMDYVKNFHRIISKGERKGQMRAFPLGGRCVINRDCKMPPIKAFLKTLDDDTVQFVGIAADEPERLKRMTGNKRSLLAEYGYTEADAKRLCEQYGMLSPSYSMSARGGCWFCPNQKISGFAYLKQNHPQLWEQLERLSKEPNKVSEGFRYGSTFEETAQEVERYIVQPTKPSNGRFSKIREDLKMNGVNAQSEEYESFFILGQDALLTGARLDRTTVPQGLYAYDLRDACDGNINELKDFVLVNHWGTVLVKEPIEGADKGVQIKPYDYNYIGGDMTVDEFMSEQSQVQTM